MRPGRIKSRDARAVQREEELVARLRRGEPDALAEVYRAHQGALRGFVQRLTGQSALADDVVQETFIALPAALDRYRAEASLRTFLMAIAARRARRHLRSAARRRAAIARLARQPVTAPASPGDLAARRDLVAALRRGIDALPPAQRDAVLLCSMAQLSSREAAAAAGAAEETLRTRLFHARRKLRRFLADEERSRRLELLDPGEKRGR